MADIPLHDSSFADLRRPAAKPPSSFPRPYSNHSTSTTFSSSANPDNGWTQISDLAERRRLQNRIAQRNYRKKLKNRLEDLERRAGPEQGDAEEQPWPEYELDIQALQQQQQQQQQQLRSVPWSPEDDQLLLIARILGLTWIEISDQYFESRTAKACSEHHEWLLEHRKNDNWEAHKTHKLAAEYMGKREEIWGGLAAQIGEDWTVVEEKCMPSDPKSSQNILADEGRMVMIKEYMRMRKEIWSGLAARMKEEWDVVEEKCMSKGLKSLQRNASTYQRRIKLKELRDTRMTRMKMDSTDQEITSLLLTSTNTLPPYPAHQEMSEDSTTTTETYKQPSKDLHGNQVSEKPPSQSTRDLEPYPARSKDLPHSRFLSWVRKMFRPKLKPGHRRIEWTCDCGVELYGDFVIDKATDLDGLNLSLHMSAENTSANSSSDSEQSVETQTKLHHTFSRSSSSSKTALSTGSTDASSIDGVQPKYLALCVNTGGIYKTLTELDTSRINSDGEAFSQMKKAYLQYRGLRSRMRFLIKPVTVEFVRFTLWNLRCGYVSISDRPNCMPPNTRIDYDCIPPPMPPEVFVHYLEHGDGDLSPNRYTWLPRLPKRLNNKVMDCGEATEGWGIHVIEGPNREAVFWILMMTISASVLASVLWSTLKGDIQGGTGLGALIVALPPAIMAAFLFRLGAA